MLATPVVIELLVEHEGYAKGTQMLAVGGLGARWSRVDEMPRIEATLLCFDEAGTFVWVPVEYAKASKPSEVVAAQAGVPLPS